jgi:hypothetical protein
MNLGHHGRESGCERGRAHFSPFIHAEPGRARFSPFIHVSPFIHAEPGRARVPLVPIEAFSKTAALAAGGHGSSLNPGNAEQYRYSEAFRTSRATTGF